MSEMKGYILNILAAVLLAASLISCAREELWEEEALSGEEVWMNVDFGHVDFDPVSISTKATLDITQESRVLNMFVLIFTPDGQRIYSHYFNKDNRLDNLNEVISADINCWYVNTTDAGKTTGTVRIKSPQTTGATLYIVANLDEDMLNISSDRLGAVGTLEELEGLTVEMMQHTTSRNGYFPMVGELSGVRVTASAVEGGTVYLERLDAKVTVNVKLADDEMLKAFIPKSCKIRKLPAGCNVLKLSDDADYDDAGYYDSEVLFDTQSTNAQGFITGATCSFYTLENRESGNLKNEVNAYHLRDQRIKDADGSYDLAQGMWLNAPEDATYIEIHGELHMKVDTEDTGMQELIGDVVYYIHLGNFGKDLNDYDIRRNTHYTYNITIHGVENIRVEVEEEKENQSGATGHVYSAIESNFTFDAHYGQRVFGFKAEDVDIDQITFYVKTPFGREGTPELTGGGYNLSDLDYKWVSFLVNETEGGSYSLDNRTYPGDKNEMLIEQGSSERLMNIVELIDFIKKEKSLYQEYKDNGFTGVNRSRFLPDSNGDYYIYVTAFVNEYYYETHPTEQIAISWKDFVNRPNRLMHILCNTRTSKDGESSVTGSIFTFRQRSIQTPYNIDNAGLQTAFGCEVVDETREDGLTFYENDDSFRNVDFGNNSVDNGLYNTACLWNLFSNGVFKSEEQRERWDSYLDFGQPDLADNRQNTFLKEGMECMRYGVLARNRDNNGNGYIDPDEVRWYIGSLQQIYALYMGDLGMESDAQLYPTALASLPNSRVDGKWQWRNHIVCSNQTTITNAGQYVDKYWPDMLWAEEGVSVSGYGKEWEKQAPNSVRCLRNLGMEDPTESSIADKGANVPTPMMVMENVGSGVYRFDLSNMNYKSVRFYTSHELIPNNEHGESSRTYYGFETDDSFITYESGYATLKRDIEMGNSPCPEGYRVPNVREAAMMSLYCPGSWWGSHVILSCSYYSHGSLGGDLYYDDGITWFFQNKYVTISSTATSLRCVKDWNPLQ